MQFDAIIATTLSHIALMGRQDADIQYVPPGAGHKAEWIKVGEPLTEAVLDQHLSGGTTAGICGENRTRLIFDLEDHANPCRDAP